ncbi:MAG: CaiB/BaiF CoA transferase family protein [Reyranellaceae bacterium]
MAGSDVPGSAPKPLQGVRVLDLGEQLPGPYAALILSDLGAEVIKVERPGGDMVRTTFPGLFRITNRDKKSVCVDLKSEAGLAALLDLVETADVLIEGFRPGVADRLGIGHAALAQRNGGLIYVSMSGYGQSGPYRDLPGHDINYMAVSGALSLCGTPDGAPAYAVAFPIADVSASMSAVISVLAALRSRDATGKGQFIDIAIADCLLPMVAARFGMMQQAGALSRRDILDRPGNGVYATADGKQIALGAVEDHFWRALVGALDMPELAEGPYQRFTERLKHTGFLQERLSAAIAQRSLDELLRIFAGRDIPAALVSELGDLRGHPQLQARNLFADAGGFTYLRFPGLPQLDHAVPGEPPALGQHTEEILGAARAGKAARRRISGSGRKEQ